MDKLTFPRPRRRQISLLMLQPAFLYTSSTQLRRKIKAINCHLSRLRPRKKINLPLSLSCAHAHTFSLYYTTLSRRRLAYFLEISLWKTELNLSVSFLRHRYPGVIVILRNTFFPAEASLDYIYPAAPTLYSCCLSDFLEKKSSRFFLCLRATDFAVRFKHRKKKHQWKN